jgi:AcrR family transcriptional regulator
MVERGAATRAKLISATQQVVHEVGYAHATTRAIAETAGVAEGTIYRHFPDKVALFFAAALEQDGAVIAELTTLPAQAGQSSVVDNLTTALERLATLREKVIPLELAIRSDPELIERRRTMTPPINPDGPTPPEAIAQYLAAEQHLGRIRADIKCLEAAIVLLATLFGIGLMPTHGPGADTAMIRSAVELFVHGLDEERPGGS